MIFFLNIYWKRYNSLIVNFQTFSKLLNNNYLMKYVKCNVHSVKSIKLVYY